MFGRLNKVGKSLIWTAFVLIFGIILAIICRYTALIMFEKKGLPAKVSSTSTPGVPFERLRISSSTRILDAFWVPAPNPNNAPSVLIFHGIGETIPLWVQVQELLYIHGISSMVFDYSGAGNSSGPASVKHIDEDALAAYEVIRQYAMSNKIYLLGFSMGSGVATKASVNIHPAPAGLILCEPLSSLQAAAAATGTPKLFAYALPDIWNNVSNVQLIRSPLLVVHSDSDHVFPLSMSQEIFDHATVPKHLQQTHGFSHTGLYKKPDMNYWSSIINFIGKGQ